MSAGRSAHNRSSGSRLALGLGGSGAGGHSVERLACSQAIDGSGVPRQCPCGAQPGRGGPRLRLRTVEMRPLRRALGASAPSHNSTSRLGCYAGIG
ncbi:unnamed protein product [Miscanthus lutarioriparius]|uniref:Uncharacterized protein n=1 Tax=Miscanthus lutarioriparius TaxID=422564 RepID=A0A811REN0_9POAL|nr:unnamed protein product [Miscanthus lutarioriparius]